MHVSDASNTAHSVARCAFASAGASSITVHCRRWGRRSASSTPAIGLEHADVIRELLTVVGKKETKMFFFTEHLLLSTRWNYRELSGGYQNIATLTVEILKQKMMERLKQRR
jgi:hypothetical protein